jgi:hypothetical protein
MLRDMCIVAIQLGSPTHFTHISQSKYIIWGRLLLLLLLLLMIMMMTKWHDWVVRIPAFYFRSPRFKSRPNVQLLWQVFFVISANPSGKCWIITIISPLLLPANLSNSLHTYVHTYICTYMYIYAYLYTYFPLIHQSAIWHLDMRQVIIL